MAVAVLFAGIAQAAHYDKSELTRGDPDIHCLLCLFAAGSAGPPAPAQLVPCAAPRYCSYRFPSTILCPQSHDPASYDARGPPLV